MFVLVTLVLLETGKHAQVRSHRFHLWFFLFSFSCLATTQILSNVQKGVQDFKVYNML